MDRLDTCYLGKKLTHAHEVALAACDTTNESMIYEYIVKVDYTLLLSVLIQSDCKHEEQSNPKLPPSRCPQTYRQSAT